MKISTLPVRTTLSRKALAGLTLSYFITLMKANKTNNVNLIKHFYRERLGSRQERAALNAVLNAICTDLKKKKAKADKMLLSSVGDSSHDDGSYKEVNASIRFDQLTGLPVKEKIKALSALNTLQSHGIIVRK